MADYHCYPLWEPVDCDSGPLSPDDLPITQSLRDALMAWASAFDATLNIETAETGFPSQAAADQFKATGYELAKRLQQELGSEFKVTHNIRAFPKKLRLR
jgi:hypothetical protein